MSTIAQSADVLPAGTWKVDPAHSQVGFAVRYLVGTFRGSFSPVEATLEVGDGGEATLTGTARAENVRVQDENLTAHLQSPEFFDAERTPELSFRSEEIVRDRDAVHLRGSLTLKEISRPIELQGSLTEPIADPFGNERIGLTLTGSVSRAEFGLDWNAPLPSGGPALADEVALTAELSLVRA